MELGKLVSHGTTFYFTVQPGYLCNMQSCHAEQQQQRRADPFHMRGKRLSDSSSTLASLYSQKHEQQRQHAEPITYYVSTATDSYADVFFYLTHMLCRPRTAVGILRWHEAYQRLLGTLPYDVFVDKVRTVRVSQFELGTAVQRACGAVAAVKAAERSRKPLTPRAEPKKFLRDTLIQCRDAETQTPVMSDPSDVQNNRILQIGYGKARRRVLGAENTDGASKLRLRQMLKQQYL